MKCYLCPRNCGTDRSIAKGYCGCTDKLYVSRATLHHWEEPCISGTNGSGTVFFSGCNMHCVYCQNREISGGEYGKEITVQRLAEIFVELEMQNAHNINLVTPTHYVPQIISALDIAKPNIPIVYNCGGYEKSETIKLLNNYINIYLTDVKYYDSVLSQSLSHAPDYFKIAFKALEEMLTQQPKAIINNNGIMEKGVIVRHLILPSHKDDSIKILEELKSSFGTDNFVLSLMSQYTPYVHNDKYPELNRRITSLEYKYVINKALDLGFTTGYMQEKSSAKEEYTPPFDLSGV